MAVQQVDDRRTIEITQCELVPIGAKDNTERVAAFRRCLFLDQQVKRSIVEAHVPVEATDGEPPIGSKRKTIDVRLIVGVSMNHDPVVVAIKDSEAARAKACGKIPAVGGECQAVAHVR